MIFSKNYCYVLIMSKLSNNHNNINYSMLIFRKSRKTFDTTETRKDLGPFIIEYGKVQSKVALKYDSWHKEILNKFGGLLGNSMTEFHVQVAKVSCTKYYFNLN